MNLLIIGGGATGLASAYIAAKRGEKVTLLEASSKLGGLLSTFDIGGTKLECFYHHFFTHDAEINWLLKELNLSQDVRFVETKMGMYRYGNIHPFTTTKDLLQFPKLSLLDKIRFGLTSLFLSKQRKWQKYENISALEWFYKWAGRRVTNTIWYPMLEIKFGEYAAKIPLAWMIGRMTQRLKSRSKGKEKLGYLKGSLQRLVDALEVKLREKKVIIFKNTPVIELLFENDRVIGVKTPQGEFRADKILVTIPTIYLAKLIPSKFSNYRKQLEKIEYFGAICVVVVTEKPLSNIYWLNVGDPGFDFGGVIEQTNFLSPKEYQGLHVTYLSRYATWREPILSKSDPEIISLFKKQLQSIYPDLETKGIKDIQVFRTKTAATVCDKNFSDKIPAYKTPIPNLYIASMAHVYPDERSVNNSIKVALNADAVLQIS
ncbi:FAD-dependent oxidoreductase [Chroococcidiopsis sp. CCALA 051]|uniref:NAD(P)/FAD-dependent oxidoreductase n=1 Tax=Chroococcidiopsis sp. CCALA 051 TaxID=869949 RepID=UPI000D0D3760|nr:NAD(P)/FAD-dependent oxidoreductase [Chroococcidiopsis sp. CCALA 051]MBE9018428.1 NAD(P)/FAD-dependent oxidoreductase [Chroococcidiopsidales cyanobacterium LEGE 13417]PSM50254.1 FAD-dependent oxidoreductase [Chroococcidiopsis sp. CCALA 051]